MAYSWGEPINAGSTTIKNSHLNELINNLYNESVRRQNGGTTNPPYPSGTMYQGNTVSYADLQSIRNFLMNTYHPWNSVYSPTENFVGWYYIAGYYTSGTTSGMMYVDVNINDGSTRLLTIYFLDWDNPGRSQNIAVRDMNTNAILDSRSVSSFSQGIYYQWAIQGHVRFEITCTGPSNSVLSGVFYDSFAPGQVPPTQTQFMKTDATTHGFWRTGNQPYGKDGWVVFNYSSYYPAYQATSFSAPSGAAGNWNTATTDSRALQYPTGASYGYAGITGFKAYNINELRTEIDLLNNNYQRSGINDCANQGCTGFCNNTCTSCTSCTSCSGCNGCSSCSGCSWYG